MAPVAITFDSVLLWIHVSAVVVGFGSLFTYPVFVAALRRAGPAERALFHRVQGQIGRYVLSPALLVILLAGAYLATDRDLWSEVWVVVPFVIAVILGGLGGAYLGPREERLAELAGGGDEAAYARALREVLNVMYLAMGLVLLAVFLMITKVGS